MLDPTTRYNEVRQKSVHNAFQKRQTIDLQISTWGVHSLELDLHGSGRDWKVYHWLLDRESSVDKFSTALRLLRRVHNAHRDHHAITVFLDLKTPFAGQPRRKSPVRGAPDKHRGKHTVNRLDTLVREHLAKKWLFTPARLRRPSDWRLQDVVARSGAWPPLSELRGSFLFVLTGPTVRLEHYRKKAKDPVAFIAPGIDRVSAVDRYRDAVFFDLEGGNRKLGKNLRARGLVSRNYWVNRRDHWDSAVKNRIHHIATDRVDDVQDPWASTRSGDVPFEALGD